MSASRTVAVASILVVAAYRAFRRPWQAFRAGGDVHHSVPTGQDPAAVLAALQVEGFAASPEVVAGETIVVVPVPTPSSRRRVHEILNGTPVNMEGQKGPARGLLLTDDA